MKHEPYRICISSPPDREHLVAEIFIDDIQWAEVNKEDGTLRAEFYPRPDGESWRLDHAVAIEALAMAGKRL